MKETQRQWIRGNVCQEQHRIALLLPDADSREWKVLSEDVHVVFLSERLGL